MVYIRPFEVEEWMDRLETTPGVLNIAETCCESISIQELAQLSTDNTAANSLDFTSRRLTYGAIPGSDALRKGISALYDHGTAGSLPIDSVIVAPGAIMANFLLLYSLLGSQDHVICVYPTYQQLYEVPKSLGSQVSLWKLKLENGWIPDVSELKDLAQSNTKMIIINNPNNPFGSTIPESVLREIADFAKSRGIMLFADEVYRPLYHSLPANHRPPPSVLSLGYDRTISTSSMSKAYSLAGIRVGWIATRDEDILGAIRSTRNYTTISVSQLDDQVASYALSEAVRPSLLRRNIELARKNCELLDKFVSAHDSVCSWTKPSAGTTAMVHFKNKQGRAVKDDEFCMEVLKQTGALMMPGSTCFGDGQEFEGYMRIGYVCSTELLQDALTKVGNYIENDMR